MAGSGRCGPPKSSRWDKPEIGGLRARNPAASAPRLVWIAIGCPRRGPEGPKGQGSTTGLDTLTRPFAPSRREAPCLRGFSRRISGKAAPFASRSGDLQGSC